MAGASIPVDLGNPGQVFACLGFLEAADVHVVFAQRTQRRKRLTETNQFFLVREQHLVRLLILQRMIEF